MSMPQVIAIALALLITPAKQSPEPNGEANADSDHRVIEIVVDTKPDWLFPGLDHPRVKAYFRSDSMVGNSLFHEPQEVVRRPLVRAGTIAVKGADDRAVRTSARRFARKLVDDVRPALEACYADALARTPTEATRLVLTVELGPNDRGAIRVQSGMLGDVFGNACVHGVLEFADVEAPSVAASLEIPVWFWLQTM
jgi:hypothetical protein